jgi:glutamyl-tRNA synthetase
VKIVTWINANDEYTVDIELVEFDHLITKQKVEENDDVKDIVNKNSKAQYSAIGEGIMRHLNKGDIIQIERRGYFFVD